MTPSIENINDITKYEFFAGHDAAGKPIWTGDFAKIKPLLDWNNNMGVVTMTYDAPLKKYLMCVTDGWPTCCENAHLHPRSRRDHRPVAAGDLHEGFRRAGLLRELPLEVHQRRRQDALAVLFGEFRHNLERRCAEVQSARRLLRDVPARNTSACARRSGAQAEPNPLLAEKNVARKAKVEVSSCYPSYRGEGATDGVVGGFPNDITKEWASNAEKAGAWIKLSWDKPQKIDRVWLFDRPNDTRSNHRRHVGVQRRQHDQAGKALARHCHAGRRNLLPVESRHLGEIHRYRGEEGTPNVGLAEFAVFAGEPSQVGVPQAKCCRPKRSRLTPTSGRRRNSASMPKIRGSASPRRWSEPVRLPGRARHLGLSAVEPITCTTTRRVRPVGSALATSKDLVHWEAKGPVLELGKPGDDDSAWPLTA